jgi:hypothetical protein
MPGASYMRRYARHLLLREIGEAGQALLCAARVRVPNAVDARAAAVAREYLVRAGLSVVHADASCEAPDALGADAVGISVELTAIDERACHELAGRHDELEPAAAALAGAFAAVEAIKAVLAVGTRAQLAVGLTLASEGHP